jgi:hypothetical protein
MTQGRGWPMDRYTGPGGGLYAGPGGGLDPYNGGGLDRYNGGGLDRYNGGGLDRYNGGGLDSSPGGGLYDGSCSSPYRAAIPPIHIWIPLLRENGHPDIADLLAKAHRLEL